MKRFLTAIIFCSLIISARAQNVGAPYFPSSLPTNTVVGRTQAGSGPASAVTLATLASSLVANNNIVSTTQTSVVTNAMLVNSTMDINGVTCTLGPALCSITATAASVTPAVTGCVSCTEAGLFYSHSTTFEQSTGSFINESTGGLDLCVNGCSSQSNLDTVISTLSAVGPGLTIGATNPYLTLIGIASNQLNITNGVVFAEAGGTFAAPTATTTSAVAMAQLAWEGHNGTTFALGGLINILATENWNSTNNGTRIQFFANATGTTYGSSSKVLELDATNGAVAYYPVVLAGASAAVGSGNVGLGNTTAASANCGSLAGAAACLKFYIGSTAHYLPYY